MQVKQFDIGGVKVNVAEVNAELQMSLYESIASRVLTQCANTLTEDVTADLVKGVLMSSERGFTTGIADIVLSSAVINGTDRKVSVQDFQGKIDSYYSLVAEAVCLNIADFFILVKNQVSSIKEQMKKAKEDQEKVL